MNEVSAVVAVNAQCKAFYEAHCRWIINKQSMLTRGNRNKRCTDKWSSSKWIDATVPLHRWDLLICDWTASKHDGKIIIHQHIQVVVWERASQRVLLVFDHCCDKMEGTERSAFFTSFVFHSVASKPAQGVSLELVSMLLLLVSSPCVCVCVWVFGFRE